MAGRMRSARRAREAGIMTRRLRRPRASAIAPRLARFRLRRRAGGLGLAACSRTGAGTIDTVGKGRLRRPPCRSRRWRHRRSTAAWHEESSTSSREPAPPSSCRATRPRPGASTAPTSARRSWPTAATRAVARDQPPHRGDHRALARHAPAGARWTAARTRWSSPGEVWQPTLAHRPAGRDPLVPPAPARRDRGAGAAGHGRHVHPPRPAGGRR